jgi:hypothetical protein
VTPWLLLDDEVAQQLQPATEIVPLAKSYE